MSCGQNLGNKRVVGFALAPLSTANALEMICLFDFVRKVRCHMGAVDNSLRSWKMWPRSPPGKTQNREYKYDYPSSPTRV